MLLFWEYAASLRPTLWVGVVVLDRIVMGCIVHEVTSLQSYESDMSMGP